MKISKIVIIVTLIVIIGAIVFIYISTESDNNDNVELAVTSSNDNNDNNDNSNIPNNLNSSNVNVGHLDVKIEEPIFGKEGKYYYRGQKDPIIDIELYNDSPIFYGAVLKVLNNFPSYTKLTWKSFPSLAFGSDRISFSEALECAGEQDKFWIFFDAVASDSDSDIRKSNQEFIDTNQSAIISAGLDNNQFNKCFLEEKYKDLVTEIYNEAISEGIDGVPTTFVNGIKVLGVHEDNFRNTVYKELKEKLMQDWEVFSDSDFSFSFLYPDTIQINKVSSPNDGIQRIDLIDSNSNTIYQIYYYKKGANERLVEQKNQYDIERIGIFNTTEINKNKVYYTDQLLTSKDNNKKKYKVDIGYLDTEIIDGFLTVVDELNIEIWGPEGDYSTEFVRLLSVGVEINN